MRLYIGNLAYGFDGDKLRAFLVEKGVQLLAEINFMRNENGLRPFVFVEVADESGEKIIQELNGEVFAGRPLKAGVAHPRK